MGKQIITILALLLTLNLFAGEPENPRKTYKEITKTDITKYADITSLEILVFGIRLGNSIDEVKEIIEKQPQLFLKEDPFNERRFYLYDTTKSQGEHLALAYFIWDNNPAETGLKEIIFYNDFIRYLVGSSKNLLTLEVINKNSKVVNSFMGYPSKKEVSLDLPDLGLKYFSYYYPERNFKVNRYITDDETSISFSIFAN